MSQNVEFSYLYRDGGNNKSYGSVVFTNPDGMSLEEAANRLTEKFDENEWFIAEQLSLPSRFLWSRDAKYNPDDSSTHPADLGPGKYMIWDDLDHCWHEFDGLSETSEPATDTRTLRQLVEQVEAINRWETFTIRTEEDTADE